MTDKGYGDTVIERDGRSDEGRNVVNCEQVGNTYCLELDDGTFIFMDLSCG